MKIIAGVICAVVAVVIAILMVTARVENKDSNDVAQKDKTGRYLTIINETGQVINEIHVSVGEGTEIEYMKRNNPDAKTLSLEIPSGYEDHTTFVVTLVDRYDISYQKEVVDVAKKGRTEVCVEEGDRIKGTGSWKGAIDKFFNND